ncbi:lactococcin 972 family bacteriocin [Cellulomonas sp. S1-8]|uniref:lactococcin 972 family bacteriocin n=1 Tax=Cellulomonas sp. S1-8 TaxID=2904790 RepID=UPI0022448824|nr:lactococcin 972 family bacteriocin [Cellulomonas sp. S1-8]UZN02500.1 lactococcin 972 family bacteriocin [Cellulomonas sp. S1-8]
MAAHGTARGPSRIRKAVLTTTLALSIAVTGATAAYAAVVQAGGGTWSYGGPSFFPSNNWSNYLHPTRSHAASVTGDVGLVRSWCRAPGVWAKATAWDSNPFRMDQARWHHC